MKPTLIALFLAAITLSPGVQSARILGVFQFSGHSHFVMFEALFKALAARGHEVTVVSHWPQKTKLPNYTDISVAGSLPTHFNNFTMEFVETLHIYGMLKFVWTYNIDMCRVVLEQPEVQRLIHSEDAEYDLIVTELFGVDCFLGLAHKKKTPFVSMISSVAFPWANTRSGNPEHPAYMPNFFLPYTAHMTFTQRLWNTIYYVTMHSASYFFCDMPMQQLARKHFGEDLPPLTEIAKNTSLILVNSHFSITQPRPMVPAMVEVAGLHIQTPKKLPEDIQKFLDESPEGAVYFSMGSLVRSDSFSPDRLNALIEAFRQLKARVLWKIDPENLPELPANVKVMRWVPQTDVLNHPSVRVFVTHGGLMGTQEAVMGGVPLVGIPLFGDQHLNVEKYVSEGVAVKLEYKDITTRTALEAINKVLADTSYKQKAERLSTLFRDRPQTPLQTAVFWTEYVIRHRGAHHLRSRAAHIPLYQYLLLDVIVALLLAAILTGIAGWLFIKIVASMCCRKKKHTEKKKTKRQLEINKID